jgi:hypothetical protein
MAIEEFESAEASGLSTKGEVATEKRVKKRIPRTALKFKGHRYAFIREPMTWHVARKCCEKFGGHLVTIQSRDEYVFLEKAFMRGELGIMLGATDEVEEGKWIWVNDEPVDFSVLTVRGLRKKDRTTSSTTERMGCLMAITAESSSSSNGTTKRPHQQ